MRLKKSLYICLSLLIAIGSFAGEVKDQDGNSYRTLQIGNQEWMAVNLNVSTLLNGANIPEAKTDQEWIGFGDQCKPAWCYYQNDPENGKQFGKLYNWYAVNDPGGLCPAGWRVPTDEDWTELIDFLGGRTVAGGKLKSTENWSRPNTGATNETEFSALPGSFRYAVSLPEGLRTQNGSFWRYRNRRGFWWSSTVGITNTAWSYSMIFGSGGIDRGYYYKQSGFSVRCVKNIITRKMD